MPKDKLTNLHRLVDLQDEMSGVKVDVEKLQFSMNQYQYPASIKSRDLSIKKLEEEIDRKKEERECFVRDRDNFANQLAEKVEKLAKLSAELDEILRPFDDIVATLETEIDETEEKTFNRLMETMSVCEWSEEDCRQAAKEHMKNHPKARDLAYKKEVLRAYRECRMGAARSQMNASCTIF